MAYNDDELLQLSGIQHFVFCRRQWALIHLEQQWLENERTFDGRQIHEKAHDPFDTEKRKNIIISRAMPVHSYELGLSGECDVVEFHKTSDGIVIFGREGLYQPVPIEYKRGEPKENLSDEIQLAAQAMCLEEMLCCEIDCGYLYYNRIRKRVKVELSGEIRQQVSDIASEMHDYFKRRYTPKVKRTKSCNVCSIKEICLPALMKKISAKEYIDNNLFGEMQNEENA